MANMVPILVHGSDFFIPSSLDGSIGASILPFVRKKSWSFLPLSSRKDRITNAGESLSKCVPIADRAQGSWLSKPIHSELERTNGITPNCHPPPNPKKKITSKIRMKLLRGFRLARVNVREKTTN